MKTRFLYLSILLLAIVIINACKKDNSFSNVPSIEFKEIQQYKFAGKDSFFDFIFTFKDGDGDIGYSQGEFLDCGQTLPNLFLAYEERKGAVFAPKLFWQGDTVRNANCEAIGVNYDSIPLVFKQRMAFIQPTGSDKSIEGEVNYRVVKSQFFVMSLQGRFKFYILDRAGNKSNIEYSSEINLVK